MSCVVPPHTLSLLNKEENISLQREEDLTDRDTHCAKVGSLILAQIQYVKFIKNSECVEKWPWVF